MKIELRSLTGKEQEEVKECWEDPEFDNIRNLFLKYLVENGVNTAMDGPKYLHDIAYLLGITTANSNDGWDVWWEKEGIENIKYIKL